MKKSREKPQEHDPLPLGIVLIGFAMVLGYFGLQQLPTHQALSAASKAPSGAYIPADMNDKRVNQHLVTTDMKRELQKSAMELENRMNAPSLQNAAREYERHFESWGVDLEQEQREADVARDIDPRAYNPTYADTPHDVVQSNLLAHQIAEKEYRQQLAEAKRRAIEKARSEGYAIELDDNLTITSVRKLPRSRLPQSLNDRDVAPSGLNSVQ